MSSASFKWFAPLLLAAAFAGGCSGAGVSESQVGVVGHTNSLTQLPDCSTVEVESSFSAMPSEVDGFYVVLDGTREVCATDLDGLQTLAYRVDNTLLANAGGNNTASDPMPGHINDPAASNPTRNSNAGGSRLVRRVTQ